ncbi:hypothetical protein BGZ76_000351 [Entomortierella beljakovae]|nr:hypothetical protein BGZ76_000351 [Entomortierella beljakovae]
MNPPAPAQQQLQHNHSNGHNASVGTVTAVTTATTTTTGTSGENSRSPSTPPVPHIRIVPHLDAPRSLHFDVVDKDVPEGFTLKIGRFTDKQALSNRVTFKSKVVSRGHAEIFTDKGKFYIRDTKSSSGTFLNHARLSPPGVESKPTQLKDGDVVQLGVDYQGGTQEIYRCVKMRLELNRSWQQQANPFRTNTLKAIRTLTTADASSSTDCCICLFRIASFQSLFVAPCSHVYHYKCIRPLLVAKHPSFLCPLCRTFANLEDSVEIEDAIDDEIPAEVMSAINESEAKRQDVPVEQVQEENPRYAEVLAEEAFAPTPPSEQAHTFQPPEIVTYPTSGAAALSQAIQSHQDGDDQDRDQLMREPGPLVGSVDDANINAGNVRRSPSSGVASTPLNIGATPTTTASTPSQISSVHQSPSSAFFMAPSPPPTSNIGTAPISFGSPQQRTRQSQGTVSPSNQLSTAGNMIQNMVRNIYTPSRSRTRTNSNSQSSLNNVIQVRDTDDGVAAGPSTATNELLQSPIQHSTGRGESHGDVFGKTLVSAPQAASLNTGNLGSENQGSFGGASLLRPVQEVDSERMSISSHHEIIDDNEDDAMDGVQQDTEQSDLSQNQQASQHAFAT